MKTITIICSIILLSLTGFSQDQNLSVDDFYKKVGISNKIVLVYFNADWCVPCIKLKPIMEQIAAEEKETVLVLDLDVDDNPAVATHFEINTLPLLMIYKNGKKVWENNTFMTKSELVKKLDLYTERK